MRVSVSAIVLASLCLAACGGGGGGSSPAPVQTGGGSSSQSSAEKSIAATNDVGAPLADFSRFDESLNLGGVALNGAARHAAAATGTCKNGVEFFAPATNGDPNSTEAKDFYDTACTVLARDAVRVFASLGSGAENVNATVQLYAPFGSTPIAVRTATRTFTNATFDIYGFPIALDGYDETSSDTLSIASSKAIDSGAEFVLGPAQSGKSSFCSDSAGFSATGVRTLNETFGWQGGVLSGGSRTVNADGSVTWAATHTGFSAKGALGSLSVNAGTKNTACPITTPMFTLAGGTTLGNYTIPISVTYLHGMVENLTISNATLTNGDTLNVSTTAGAAPSSSSFITASVASGGTQISILAVNGYGDGTLTVTATGRQFAVVDWHVVH